MTATTIAPDPKPGERWIMRGFQFDIHQIKAGQVWYRRWKPRQRKATLFEGLGRMTLAKWRYSVRGEKIKIKPAPPVADAG